MWQSLKNWLKSTKSSVFELTWEARFWVALGIAGVIYSPLAASVPVIFFMSAWANFRSAAIQKRELEETVEEEIEEIEVVEEVEIEEK